MAQTDAIAGFNPFERRWERTRRTIYNSLAHYDSNLKLQPELAEKWSLAADGKSMTFKLREGVKYHSGREFTSADVKFSLEFAAGDERTLQRPMYQMIKQIETPDKYTVVLRMAAPNANIFDLIDVTHAIDKETINDSAKIGIGTGPFRVDKFVPSDRIEMVANKDYWDKGKPYVDRYVSRIVPDPSAMAVWVESGEVDCVWRASYSDAARLQASGGKVLVDTGAQGSGMFDVGINTKLAPFTDKRVRQAIAWSIDRERFCRTVTQGISKPTCLIWPPHSWAYQKDLEGKIGYDLDKAKALLKEAGLEKGFETEILTSAKRQFGYGELAQLLQADLKKIGINAKLADVEPAQYDSRTQQGDIAILAHTYGRANMDPATTLTAAKSWYSEKDKGWTHFESAEYDRLRTELQTELDHEKRVKLARAVQELALDQCFTLPVAGSGSIWLYASYLKGLRYDFVDAPYAEDFWLDK